MKCKRIELIELTICMVGGTESGARIYDAKFCMVGVWVGGILCKGDQELHVILYISDKNGTSKLNKLTIFDQKWNFWNLVAMFDK